MLLGKFHLTQLLLVVWWLSNFSILLKNNGPTITLAAYEEDAEIDTHLIAHQQELLDQQESLEQSSSLMRAKRRDGRKIGRRNRSPESRALEAWAHSLTDKDYNYTEWRVMFHSRSTVDFFNGYARKLSKLFQEHEAKVNFAMIGKLLSFAVVATLRLSH